MDKEKEILKSSKEWELIYAEEVSIIDADGWDRNDFDKSWNELITENEFNKRICSSTCVWFNIKV